MELVKSALKFTGRLIFGVNFVIFVSSWFWREWLSNISPSYPDAATQQVVLEKGGFYITPAQAWWLDVQFTFCPLAMLVATLLLWAGGYNDLLDKWPSRWGARVCIAVLVLAAATAATSATSAGRHFVSFTLTESGLNTASNE